MVKVICDTSFLILLATKRIKNIDSLETDIGSLEFVVPKAVIEELERLSEKEEKSNESKQTLELIKSFETIPIYGNNVDSAIIQHIKDNGGIVATVDKELKNMIKKHNGSIISLSNNRIVLE
ncbi:MAG: twitching motility protein PilT [Nitrosopumilaceae archaeon]|nr:twitching motility protein PilT [Nitrosopumilaceae archaeon]NIU00270.1 twitching motility protein PilT [Nitrosopumilaceae archaeon]NIU86682.1 twitching motility protein PilT [Nitrosopumilaceae archaeon]NIV65377.1 twitching motility protein PilT [Nitrosopumilaceae archaeon]NIX60872.1 twitching motility protein PilT [Nitrosopumilaceae archaeon]